ncbi:MAG: hypothetical protein KDA98_15665, partial [Acidimicrobiales bacterium]|nr:hypothetical protein [Acidimicrobiales bacterium]
MSRTSPARRPRLAVALALALIAGIATLAPSTATAAPRQDATTSSVSISAFEQIAIGTAHACGIDDQADLYCWGRNGDGQLGTGTQDDELLPVPVAVSGTPLDGKDIDDVATGYSSTCALATDDTLACWGEDDEDQLGNGGAASSLVPTAVSVASTPLDGADIVDIDLNHKHVCALTSTGAMSCWGLGSVGQIGQGTQANALVPTGVVTA